jgi:hypothetical protein
MKKRIGFLLVILLLFLPVFFTCKGDGDSESETYTVTYDGNGYTSGTVPVDINSYEESDVVRVLGNTGNVLRTGYSFMGWNTRSDGLGTTYSEGQTFFMGSFDVTLYARWILKWTSLLGAKSKDTYGYGIAVDSSGNCYVTGYTNGNLGGEDLTGNIDVFVIKYDSSGTSQWTRLLGVDTKDTYGSGIAIDSSGNCYVTGFTNGDLDEEDLTGNNDVFIIKYNSSGTKLWTRLLGVTDKDTRGLGIAVDSSGNCYVTGYTNSDLDEGDSVGDYDVFVIKYDTSGTRQWTKLLGVTDKDTRGYGISVDSSGNCYVTGKTDGNLDGKKVTGTNDVFVIKYDSSGVKQWTSLLGVDNKNTYGYGTAVDSSGNCYVTGYTDSDLDGGDSVGIYDVFVIKYNSSGTRQWTSLLGVDSKNTYGYDIAVDSDGNCYVTGYTDSDLDGGDSVGTNDVFVIKYNSSGTRQWTRLLGVAGAITEGKGISIDSNGNSYVTGVTYGDLDGEDLTGDNDVFVTTKLNE